MSASKETCDVLETVAKVLLRSTILGFLLVLLWFGLYMLAPALMRGQAEWFGLTPHEVDVLHYCGIGIVKIFILIFFLFPYVAIRLVLRNEGRHSGG